MCHPSQVLRSVAIVLDGALQPAGAVVIDHWQTDHESVRPLDVGPFDTAAEVLQHALGFLTEQPALW